MLVHVMNVHACACVYVCCVWCGTFGRCRSSFPSVLFAICQSTTLGEMFIWRIYRNTMIFSQIELAEGLRLRRPTANVSPLLSHIVLHSPPMGQSGYIVRPVFAGCCCSQSLLRGLVWWFRDPSAQQRWVIRPPSLCIRRDSSAFACQTYSRILTKWARVWRLFYMDKHAGSSQLVAY